MKNKAACFFFLFFFAVNYYSQEYSFTSQMDWVSQRMNITIQMDITRFGSVLPLAEKKASQLIENYLITIFTKAFESVNVNSREKVVDILHKDVSFISKLDTVSRSGTIKSSLLSADTKKLVVEYIYPLYPNLVSIIPRPGGKEDIQPQLEFSSTKDFTGVIFYAAEALPVRGQDQSALLEPAIHPRIFNMDLKPVLLPSNQPDSVILNSGVLRYGRGYNLKQFEHITGKDPIIIMVKQVFGIHHTDLVISNEDAGRLLYSEANRNLLRSGKIVVIIE